MAEEEETKLWVQKRNDVFWAGGLGGQVGPIETTGAFNKVTPAVAPAHLSPLSRQETQKMSHMKSRRGGIAFSLTTFRFFETMSFCSGSDTNL